MPAGLTDALKTIDAICIDDNKNVEDKVNELYDIYSFLSDDEKRLREGRYVIIRIGELCYANRLIEEAMENFSFVMQFKDTIGNPYLHLRMGQLFYCKGNNDKMLDELSRALIMGGDKVFEGEDLKFINLAKDVLKEPSDCAWDDYEGQDWTHTK